MKYYPKEKEYVNSILFQGIAEIFFYGSVIRVSEPGVGTEGEGERESSSRLPVEPDMGFCPMTLRS